MTPKIQAATIPYAGLIDRATDLEWQLQKGFRVELRDVLADEYFAMRVLDEERARKDSHGKTSTQKEIEIPKLPMELLASDDRVVNVKR